MRIYSKLTLMIGLLTGSYIAGAQAVTATEQTVDKNKLSGLSLSVPIEGKQAEKDWAEQLKSYGKVTNSRGTYKVATAYIPALSPEPINLISTVDRSRNSATIFTAFDLGGGNFITSGSDKYPIAEKMLTDFASTAQYNQQVRDAEGLQTDADKSYQKAIKTGERLQRDIERNKKEKETLLRRLDDNAKELEQLTKDTESNKTEQTTTQADLDNRRKAVEAVRLKKPQ